MAKRDRRFRQRQKHAENRKRVDMSDDLTADDWMAARRILVEGNISFTDDDILRRLAQIGVKIAKIRDDDHVYVAGLLRSGERFS